MLIALILIPLIAAGVACFLADEESRPWLLPATAAIHLLFALAAAWGALSGSGTAAELALEGGLWLRLDPLGSFFLLVVSLVFAVTACYAPGYLRTRSDRSNRIFATAFLAFPGFASLACAAQHFGLLWVGIESCTVCVAPLIWYNRTPQSVEATWKYLMLGSVGLALALLGTFFLAYASVVGGNGGSLTLEHLVAHAPGFSRPWLHSSFVLLLVGYGTKMGLAPLHTWKPDVYGETPGIVGALLAGGMTTVAFLALLRVLGVLGASGEGAYARELLMVMGLLSMAWAAVFMVRQTDLKRLLAYSSVEHMGVLAFAAGLGGKAAWFCLFHVLANALVKTVLFLSAGNIHRAFASKHIPVVSGAILRLPVSGALLLVGFFAITGSPPFAPFVSEFGIVQVALGSGRWFAGGFFLLCLLVIFIGISHTIISAVLGDADAPEPEDRLRDRAGTVGAPLAAALAVLLLGLWTPPPLRALLDRAGESIHREPVPAALAATGVAP